MPDPSHLDDIHHARPMKKSKWPDFLFTVAVRFICGALIGALVSLPVIFFAGRGTRSRRTSLLVEWLNAEKHTALILWFGAWALAGGLIALWTIPRWQMPWYKPKRWNKDDDDVFIA
jgi:hypothetical protein